MSFTLISPTPIRIPIKKRGRNGPRLSSISTFDPYFNDIIQI
jgi:hypothetical protein